MPDRETSDLPWITIGITAHDAEETIAPAMNSALGQIWPDTAIVDIVKCSIDGAADAFDPDMRRPG